jgi:hypothetical protein
MPSLTAVAGWNEKPPALLQQVNEVEIHQILIIRAALGVIPDDIIDLRCSGGAFFWRSFRDVGQRATV